MKSPASACTAIRTLVGACLIGSLFAAAAVAAAQTPAAETMQAVPLLPGELIRIDGTLSHPAWQRAPVFSNFVEKSPSAGATPVQATTVQLLVDGQALYVGITALDDQPERIRDFIVRNDGVNRTQDFVVVYLDPIGTRSAAQFFRINAAGSMADGLQTAADDNEDFSPDFDWDGAAARTEPGESGRQGWTAVLRLPFATLRYAAGAQPWRVMVARRLPRDQFHLFTSVLIPDDAASFIATLQPLAGVQLPASAHFLTLRPGLTLRTTHSNERNTEPNTEPGQPRRKNAAEASLDVKWRPRAELVIDGTLNPDFSQLALDVPQLAGNSRFALFLPEKRPFFFESADLLRTPTDALYTRSFTQPRAGLRATWRDLSFAGTAFAIRDRGQGRVLLPGPYGTGSAEQPASDSVALRGRHDDGRLAIGGLAVVRRYALGAGDNSVIGPDVNWQISDRWRLRAQWLHARTTAQVHNGRLTEGQPVDGDRVRLRLMRQTGTGETMLGLDDIAAGFRDDSGFVNQAGVRRVELFHSTGWRGVGPFNELFINVDAAQVRDRAGGVVVQEFVRPGIWATAARNVEWWFNVYLHSRVRTAAAAPLLAERYASTGLVMTPANWLPLIDVSVDYGRLADTQAGPLGADGTPQGLVRRGGRLNLSAKLRLLPRLELEPRLSHAWLDDDGDAAQARQPYRETQQQWLAVWHFDARHSLRAILQRGTLARTAEPGSAAQAELARTESLTYAWRHSAGTRLYVGAARARSGRVDPRGSTEGFVKIELDVDDLRR